MSNPLFKTRDCGHPDREGVHEEYVRPDGSSFCRACGLEIEPAITGWIVGDSDGARWRTWKNGYPEWTTLRDEATRYHRRCDAEAVHGDDDEAWRAVPFAR